LQPDRHSGPAPQRKRRLAAAWHLLRRLMPHMGAVLTAAEEAWQARGSAGLASLAALLQNYSSAFCSLLAEESGPNPGSLTLLSNSRMQGLQQVQDWAHATVAGLRLLPWLGRTHAAWQQMTPPDQPRHHYAPANLATGSLGVWTSAKPALVAMQDLKKEGLTQPQAAVLAAALAELLDCSCRAVHWLLSEGRSRGLLSRLHPDERQLMRILANVLRQEFAMLELALGITLVAGNAAGR
jgi:hypothetical protein